jgi:hypothetical protein
MRSGLHHLQYGGKRLEVSLLCGDQWVRFEERNHDLDGAA